MEFDVILSTGAVVKHTQMNDVVLAYIEGRIMTDAERGEYSEIYEAYIEGRIMTDAEWDEYSEIYESS